MWNFVGEYWDHGVDIATLIVAILALLATAGLLQRRSKTLKNLVYIEQERDEFRKKLSKAEVRLKQIDPERFIDAANAAYEVGNFQELENLSLSFSNAQSEAFGKAAEYLAEQRILDSEQSPDLADDALRFAAIGRAANPDSKRLEELENLARRRREGIKRDEPIEALNFDGLDATQLYNLSEVLRTDGKFALAEIAIRRSVPLTRLRDGKLSKNFAASLQQHGLVLNELGEFGAAETLCREALEINKATIGEGHPGYATDLNNLAGVVSDQGRFAEAESLYREALEIDKATIGEQHPDYATRLNNLAIAVKKQGRFAEAETLYREALDIDKATIGEGHPSYARHLGNLGDLLVTQGKPDEGRAMLLEALDIFCAALPADHPDIAETQRRLDAIPPDAD